MINYHASHLWTHNAPPPSEETALKGPHFLSHLNIEGLNRKSQLSEEWSSLQEHLANELSGFLFWDGRKAYLLQPAGFLPWRNTREETSNFTPSMIIFNSLNMAVTHICWSLQPREHLQNVSLLSPWDILSHKSEFSDLRRCVLESWWCERDDLTVSGGGMIMISVGVARQVLSSFYFSTHSPGPSLS